MSMVTVLCCRIFSVSLYFISFLQPGLHISNIIVNFFLVSGALEI